MTVQVSPCSHLLPFRLCLVRVKAFPENIPFSGKENIFMCLVVFQKIFRKIFSGVWKMLQGKRQNQKNKHNTQIDPRDQRGSTARCFASSSPTTAPSIAISRSTAPITIGAKASSRSRIAIDDAGACEWRWLELGRADGANWLCFSLSRSHSLSLSLFGIHLKWK